MSDRELAITIMKWEQEGAKLGGPLNDLIEEIKQLFVEQTCEVIESIPVDVEYGMISPDEAMDLIRDKFK